MYENTLWSTVLNYEATGVGCGVKSNSEKSAISKQSKKFHKAAA